MTTIFTWLALSLMPIVQTPVKIGPCPDSIRPQLPCYHSASRTVYSTRPLDRWIVYHEFGHALDYQRLTDDERRRIQALLGLPAEMPWRWQGHTQVDPPEEYFASVYAHCALRRRLPVDFYGRVILARRQRAICAIAREAAWRGPIVSFHVRVLLGL